MTEGAPVGFSVDMGSFPVYGLTGPFLQWTSGYEDDHGFFSVKREVKTKEERRRRRKEKMKRR